MPFNKFTVRVLSNLKHSAVPRVLNLIKHCCSFIKHYIMICFLNKALTRCMGYIPAKFNRCLDFFFNFKI